MRDSPEELMAVVLSPESFDGKRLAPSAPQAVSPTTIPRCHEYFSARQPKIQPGVGMGPATASSPPALVGSAMMIALITALSAER